MASHIGIVMDGNRRYAQSKGLPGLTGHKQGLDNLSKIMDSWIEDDYGVHTITLYVFSMENFGRDDNEKDAIFRLFRNNIQKFANDKLRKKLNEKGKAVSINFLGRLNLFPQDMQDSMLRIMEDNPDEHDYTLNLLMAYNGQDEIVDAVRRILMQHVHAEDIDREMIKKNMYLSNSRPPEIIIRTGSTDGQRLSGFMLWDSSYSELYFEKKLWPEFTYGDIKVAIDDFRNNRKRRFGK